MISSYRHANRADRRAIARVSRLVAGESPAETRARLMRGRWMYGSRPEERRRLVRAHLRRFAVCVLAALVPVAVAVGAMLGLRAIG